MKVQLEAALGASLAIILIALIAFSGAGASAVSSVELLNASYDPTRELWQDLNQQFIPLWESRTGQKLTIKQSHASSGGQSRAVIDGLDADVVSLALWTDTQEISKRGLIAPDWQSRLPNHSLPYYSTIVFVVRAGNPQGIHDWPDLASKNLAIITPNPKTSGNGKLSFLAAWGSVLERGGSETDAQQFVQEIYRRVPVLDTGARAATITFAQKKIGDIHLTWENEALLELAEAGGELEIIYPSASIRAEPFVAVVDSVVDRKGTRSAAEAYLRHLFSRKAQELIARHGFRPIEADILIEHRSSFPDIKLFPITAIARDWDEAQRRFFADGRVFDQIFAKR